MLMSVCVSACMRVGVPVCERAFMMHEHCETIVREFSTSVYCETADSSREKTLLFYQIQTYNTYRVAVKEEIINVFAHATILFSMRNLYSEWFCSSLFTLSQFVLHYNLN